MTATTVSGPIQIDAAPVRYEPALDGIRALTVVAIMVFHFGLEPYYRGGVINVDVFFILSGFLITNLLLDEQNREGVVSFRGFYHRRILRLFPAMYALLAAYLLAALVIGWKNPSIWAEWFAAATYSYQLLIGFFGFGTPGDPRYMLHLWTLSVEEWFYFFWPLLLVLSLRKVRSQRILIGGCVAFIAFWTGIRLSGNVVGVNWTDGAKAFDGLNLPYFMQVTYRFSVMRFDMLVAGCLLALVRRKLPPLQTPFQRRVIAALAVIGLIMFLGVTFLGGRVSFFDPFGSIGFNLALLTIPPVVLWVHYHPKSWPAGLLSIPIMVWLGRRSYALYLWHQVLNGLTPAAPTKALWVVRTIVLFAGSCGVAALSWKYVESPFLRRKEKQYGGPGGTKGAGNNLLGKSDPPVVEPAAHGGLGTNGGPGTNGGDGANGGDARSEPTPDLKPGAG